MTKTVLNLIPAANIGDVYPLVETMLKDMVPRSNGRLTIGSIVRDLTEGRLQLWTAWDPESKGVKAIALTEIYRANSGARICSVRGCTGQQAEDWVHHLGTIEAWALAQECVAIEALARKGWARHLTDYKLTHVLLEKPLTGAPAAAEAA